MNNEKQFTDIDSFIEIVKGEGINKLAFSYVDETRSVPGNENSVDVIRVEKVDVLAYKGGVIFKYSSSNNNDTYIRLVDEGFEIEKRSRNII